MKKIILLFTLFSLNLVHSQNDIRAEKLLNSVSEKIDSSETFKINFTYTCLLYTSPSPRDRG